MPNIGSLFSLEITFQTIDAPEAAGHETELRELERPFFDGEVLLCEDNRMNQEVIGEHLKRVGLTAVVAENGQEGVDMVRDRAENGGRPFDLIFMDIHMPVMDGLEAASKIAEMDIKTPIIAMTANVMSNEKELYSQSRMSDCVGKPFTSQELWRCLLKYLTPVRWQNADGGTGDEGGVTLRQKLAAKFVRDNRNRHAEIAKAMDDGDLKLAHRLAHTLKSNAGMIGTTMLQKAAEDIERALADGRTPEPEPLNILETELRAALNELAPLAEQDAAAKAAEPAEAFDSERARELIEKLEPLLEAGSPKCLAFMAEIRLMPESGELARQIEDFDFDQAAETLAELKKSLEHQTI
jgi:CheY-like chemotaxis protein